MISLTRRKIVHSLHRNFLRNINHINSLWRIHKLSVDKYISCAGMSAYMDVLSWQVCECRLTWMFCHDRYGNVGWHGCSVMTGMGMSTDMDVLSWRVWECRLTWMFCHDRYGNVGWHGCSVMTGMGSKCLKMGIVLIAILNERFIISINIFLYIWINLYYENEIKYAGWSVPTLAIRITRILHRAFFSFPIVSP